LRGEHQVLLQLVGIIGERSLELVIAHPRSAEAHASKQKKSKQRQYRHRGQ